jgi:ribose 5-phosphate isomerase B
MKIFLGSDHNGFHLKEDVFAYLVKRDFDVEDVGDQVLDKEDDFPEFAAKAAIKLLGSEDEARAILLCGGAQGMAMAANRFDGIRASVVWDSQEAKITRNDNDSNILCLPSRILEDDPDEWKNIIDTWLTTPFANAQRYRRRNNQLDNLR